VASNLSAILRRHAVLILPSALYIVLGVVFIEQQPQGSIGGAEVLLAWLGTMLGLVVGLLGGQAFWILIALRPQRPFTALLKRVRVLANKTSLQESVPVLFLLGPFSLVFSEIKSLIPLVNPFSWDPLFARLDAFIHGGRQPWEWLAGPLISGPMISALSLLYAYGWHVIGFAVFAHVCLAEKSNRLRLRYFLAFFAAWALLGNVAATVFSSAGPAYYQYIAEPSGLFASLMQELRALETAGWLTPVPMIDLLWRAYESPGAAPPGLGISAMPSLHVAMGCLYFLYARHHGGLLLWMAGFYFLVTLIGSVALAWHYAIDGYAAIVGMALIWIVAGWITALDSSLEARPSRCEPRSTPSRAG